MVSGEMLRVQTYQKIKNELPGNCINYSDKHFQDTYIMIHTVLDIFNKLSNLFLTLKIYLVNMLKLRHRKIKGLSQDTKLVGGKAKILLYNF